jgi:hypothetical protein
LRHARRRASHACQEEIDLTIPEARCSIGKFLRNVALPAAADAMGLVQKEIPIAQGAFCILINRDDDCLDVVITPPFPAS